MKIKQFDYIKIINKKETFNPFSSEIVKVYKFTILSPQESHTYDNVLGMTDKKRYVIEEYNDNIIIANEGAFIKISDKEAEQYKLKKKGEKLFNKLNINRIKKGTKLKLTYRQAYSLCLSTKSFIPNILTVKDIRMFMGYDFNNYYEISFVETDSKLTISENDYIEIIEDSNDETVR